MKAVTIWQPWASAIALGFKHFETRVWATNYRGPIAIHAAAKFPTKDIIGEINTKYLVGDIPFYLESFSADGYRALVINVFERTEYPESDKKILNEALPLGEVVAIAELTDCIEMTKEFISSLSPMERALGWYEVGRYAWKLENVRPIKSVKAKGQQGLWNWNGEYEVI